MVIMKLHDWLVECYLICLSMYLVRLSASLFRKMGFSYSVQAFAIMEEDLGRPLEQVFSSISERPIAAASLGQVSVYSL